MNWIKRIAKEYIMIFSLIVTFTALMLLLISNYYLSGNKLNYDINGLFTYLIPICFVFVIAYILNNTSSIKLQKEGIGKGLLLGWPFILVGLYNFIISCVEYKNSSVPFPSIQTILLYSLIMLCIGIFEEVLARGITMSNMLNKWGYNKAGLLKSIIISSLIFGLGHLVNLVIFPNLIIRTFSQIIYASFHGILYASIYYRTKNIWAVIILHGIYDWMILISGILQSANDTISPSDISIVSGLLNILFAIPFVLYAFFLLRKELLCDTSQAVTKVKSI